MYLKNRIIIFFYFFISFCLLFFPFHFLHISLFRWVLLNWETKTKRNEMKRNETKYNETKRNEKWRNETKRNEISQNETKYVKQSIKDPKTINEGVKNQRNIEWLVRLFIDLHFCCKIQKGQQKSCINTVNRVNIY